MSSDFMPQEDLDWWFGRIAEPSPEYVASGYTKPQKWDRWLIIRNAQAKKLGKKPEELADEPDIWETDDQGYE